MRLIRFYYRQEQKIVNQTQELMICLQDSHQTNSIYKAPRAEYVEVWRWR